MREASFRSGDTPLTPLRAKALKIKRSLDGYDCAEVDSLLDELASGYEKIWLERISLQQQLDQLGGRHSRSGLSQRSERGRGRAAILLAAVITLVIASASIWTINSSGKRSSETNRIAASHQPPVRQTDPARRNQPARDARNVPATKRQTATVAGETRSNGRPVSAASSRDVAKLGLTAARGDCWLSIRSGSASGRLLFEGTLPRGRSIQFAGKRLWVRFGASRYLDLKFQGRSIKNVFAPTGEAIVTKQGIRIISTS